MPNNASKTSMHHSNQCHTGPKLLSRDTSTETESDADSITEPSLQDHIVHLPRPTPAIQDLQNSTNNHASTKISNTRTTTTLQKMKSPQHLQKHAQYHLQDHQKPQTSSKQVQINENHQCKFIQSQHQLEITTSTHTASTTFFPGPSTVNSSRHTYIPRPSTFNSSRKSTFARPSEFNNNRFHQQPSTDTTTADTITPNSSIHRTIPTDTRTPHTTSMLSTSTTTASATTLHCMK